MPVVPAENMKDYIGKELGVSDWFVVDQERINKFADVTEDHQFIHIDEEATKPLFGSTIAHGFLSLSLLPHLASQSGGLVPENVKAGINYGLDKVRFINPVPSGSKVRVRSTLKDVSEKNPGQWLLKSEAVMEIEGVDKPAYVAESLTLFIT
ncbi:MAG: MaoC family dehydratase [Pseudomonadota bacterium]|nr:MaoC family dehydratase [Pseudomonadota bacterium]